MKKAILLIMLVATAALWALNLPDEVAWYPLHGGEGTEAKEGMDRLPPAKITGAWPSPGTWQ